MSLISSRSMSYSQTADDRQRRPSANDRYRRPSGDERIRASTRKPSLSSSSSVQSEPPLAKIISVYEHFVSEDLDFEQTNGVPPKRVQARENLQKKLDDQAMRELGVDVHDEIIRREEAGDKVSPLPPVSYYDDKRNRTREKLHDLSPERFKELVGDLYHAFQARFKDQLVPPPPPPQYESPSPPSIASASTVRQMSVKSIQRPDYKSTASAASSSHSEREYASISDQKSYPDDDRKRYPSNDYVHVSELERMQKERARLMEQQRQTQESHDALKESHNVLKDENALLQKEYKTLQQDAKRLEHEYSKVKQRTDDDKRSRSDSESRVIKQLEAECEKYKEYKQMYERLQKKHEALQNVVEDVKTDIHHMRDELRTVEQLKAENTELKEQMSYMIPLPKIEPLRTSRDGLINASHIYAFQNAIDDLLDEARNSVDPTNLLVATESIANACVMVTKDIEASVTRQDSTSKLNDLKGQLLNALRSLMSAANLKADKTNIVSARLLPANATQLTTIMKECVEAFGLSAGEDRPSWKYTS